MNKYNVNIRLQEPKHMHTYNVIDIVAENEREAEQYAIQLMALDIGYRVKIKDIKIRLTEEN